MFNFFRRQKPKEDKNIEPGSKSAKDVPKNTLPIRLFKNNEDCKKSPKIPKDVVSKNEETRENDRLKATPESEITSSLTGNSPSSEPSFEKAYPKSAAKICDTQLSLKTTAHSKSAKAHGDALNQASGLSKNDQIKTKLSVETSVTGSSPNSSETCEKAARLAFFEGLLEPEKGSYGIDPKPFDVNKSVEAFDPVVDKFPAHVGSPSQGSCKLGLLKSGTGSVNTPEDSFSSLRTLAPRVTFCDSLLVKNIDNSKQFSKNTVEKCPDDLTESARGNETASFNSRDSGEEDSSADTLERSGGSESEPVFTTAQKDSKFVEQCSNTLTCDGSSKEQDSSSSGNSISQKCSSSGHSEHSSDDNFESFNEDSSVKKFDESCDGRDSEKVIDESNLADWVSSCSDNSKEPSSICISKNSHNFETNCDDKNPENLERDSSELRLGFKESFNGLNVPDKGADLAINDERALVCDRLIPTIVIEDLDGMGSSSSSAQADSPTERMDSARLDSESVRTSSCDGTNVECLQDYMVTVEEKSAKSVENEKKPIHEESTDSEKNDECEESDESEDSDGKSDTEMRPEEDVFVSGTDEEKEEGVELYCSRLCSEENGTSTQEQRLNLVNKESSVQDRLHELTTELANREAETIQLRYQLEEAQKQLLNKTWGMDRLQNELLTSHQESEGVKERLRSLENDLNCYQHKDSNFNKDTYRRKTGVENGGLYPCSNCDKFERTLDAVNRKVRELEEELGNVKRERDKLEEEANSWEAEREQEIKIVQQALQDAEKEKNDMRTRFEKEFESLRTVNTDREQHLLDDFEWKLREVEQACKKRLHSREQVVREQCLEEQIKLRDQIQELEIKLKLHHSHEAELGQLRGLSNEQQRSLKVATRQVEQFQNSEKILKEEVEKLKSLLQKEKTHLATMQGIHNREIAEKERKFQFKLEQYKAEVNAQVDEKVQRECARLRIELDRQHKEERRADLEAAKVEMEKDTHLKKQNWDRRMQECINELDILQRKLANKDKEYKQELENIQTMSDRDMMELRRKLDKMDMSYQEKLEKAQEKCDKEIERINLECEKRIRESEEATRRARSALELEKGEQERELEERLAEVGEEFEKRLQEERQELLREKEEALAAAEQRHRSTIDNLRNQLDSIYKSRNYSNNTRQDSLMHLHQELSVTSESSATDEGCVRERIHASEDESACLQSQEEEDQFSPLPQMDTNKRLDENRERTGNAQMMQTRSSRRKRRSRAQQRARMNVNFAPAS